MTIACFCGSSTDKRVFIFLKMFAWRWILQNLNHHTQMRLQHLTCLIHTRSQHLTILFQETVQSERTSRDPWTAGRRLLLRVLHALLSEMLQMLYRRWWPKGEPPPSTEGHLRLSLVGCPWRQVGLDTEDDTKRSQTRQRNHGVEAALQPHEEHQH